MGTPGLKPARTTRMKLVIATVAVLVCLCGMKGVLADDYYGSGPYSGSYGGSYGGIGGYSGGYGKMGYGMGGYGGYSGYGKGGYGGYSGYGKGGYGGKHYSGYGKKGQIIDETIIQPGPIMMPVPIA